MNDKHAIRNMLDAYAAQRRRLWALFVALLCVVGGVLFAVAYIVSTIAGRY